MPQNDEYWLVQTILLNIRDFTYTYSALSPADAQSWMILPLPDCLEKTLS